MKSMYICKIITGTFGISIPLVTITISAATLDELKHAAVLYLKKMHPSIHPATIIDVNDHAFSVSFRSIENPTSLNPNSCVVYEMMYVEYMEVDRAYGKHSTHVLSSTEVTFPGKYTVTSLFNQLGASSLS